MPKEYKTIREVVGPLMLVEQVEGVKFDELVKIKQASGDERIGKVLEVNEDKSFGAALQFLAGFENFNRESCLSGTRNRNQTRPDILGRVFDGMGRPIDGVGKSYRKSSVTSTVRH